MGTAEKFDLSQKRTMGRVSFLKEDLWTVKVGGRTVPAHWLQDLSSAGLRLGHGRLGLYPLGEEIRVQLLFRGQKVFDASGAVRWRQPSTLGMNMFDVGVEFSAPAFIDKGFFENEKLFKGTIDRRKIEREPRREPSKIWKYVSRLELAFAVAWPFMIGVLTSIYFRL